MTFTEGGVIVIKERNELRHSFDLKLKMDNHDRVLVYLNGKVQSVKNDSEKTVQKTMLVILLEDLKIRLDFLECNYLEKHYEYGLSRTIDPKGTVSILNLVTKKCKFAEFSKYTKNDEQEYDIPIFYPKAPKIFSCFMTMNEYIAVENHIRTKGVNNEHHNEHKEEDVRLKPIPRKEHFFCHTCQRSFENYQDHIVSSIHITNTTNNSNYMVRINKTFERIRNNVQNNIPSQTDGGKNEKIQKIDPVNTISLENNNHQECVQPNPNNSFNLPIKLDTNNTNKKSSEKINIENKENYNSNNNIVLNRDAPRIISPKSNKVFDMKNSQTKNNSNKKHNIFSHKKRKFSETLLNSIEASLQEKTRRVKLPESFKRNGFHNFIGELHTLQNLFEKTRSFNIK